MRKLILPLSAEQIKSLKAGDQVLLSGKIYTARDAAHKRICENGAPFDLKDACIYYTGPCPAINGYAIGSCGPTTSKRMDAYAPTLYESGVQCVVGKGSVSDEVKKSIIKNSRVYFCATGGLGALLASRVKSAKLIAYEDLLSEAVRELIVEDFPVTVAIDCTGRDIYEEGPKKYVK